MSELSEIINFLPADIVNYIILHYLDCLAYFDDFLFGIKFNSEIRDKWVNSQTSVEHFFRSSRIYS